MQSLHRLSIENPWFAIHPLLWTADHLALVRCSFQQVDYHANTPSRDNDELISHAKCLAIASLPVMKSYSALHLLCPGGSPLESIPYVAPRNLGQPLFRYAGRRVHYPQCDIYRPEIQDTHHPLIIGFFHYNNVTKEREKKLTAQPHPGDGYNMPVTQLYLRKLRRVTPALWYEDPYLLCVLLALAQTQWYGPHSPRPASILIRLLVTNEIDTTHAHIFQADFSHDLLQSLQTPLHAMKDIAWPTIQHTQIPFEPYPSLSERIVTYIVGAEHESSIDTTTAMPRIEKRKCDEEGDTHDAAQRVNKQRHGLGWKATAI
ncbi:hypothetical protein F53441_14525 [Fusarium austroafricanum]|uniref:Uncharacterized protein n=1 Tax=Fusarium austroafricanum TaxID=2364996 RepID=A0A8H4JBK3_9HYPO|nr:hypothetical protein F53441_14525 [Fusarium austroafricanum]